MKPWAKFFSPSGAIEQIDRPKDERKTAQGFSPGKVRRLALPKQDRIMLPAGLDVLGRPKGENRIPHGCPLQLSHQCGHWIEVTREIWETGLEMLHAFLLAGFVRLEDWK